jgi:hypothetical protein
VKKTIRVTVELLDDGEPVASARKSESFEGDAGDYFGAGDFAGPLAYVLAAMVSLGVCPPAESVVAEMIDKLDEWGGCSGEWSPVVAATRDYLAAFAEKLARLKKGTA